MANPVGRWPLPETLAVLTGAATHLVNEHVKDCLANGCVTFPADQLQPAIDAGRAHLEQMAARQLELEPILTAFRYQSSQRGLGLRGLMPHHVKALAQYLAPLFGAHHVETWYSLAERTEDEPTPEDAIRVLRLGGLGRHADAVQRALAPVTEGDPR